MRVALTVDDAPSVTGDAVVFRPQRMDAIRELLRAAGVGHCVAFVIGARARGAEDALQRWLADGFELGNHSDDHVGASACDRDAFARSVERCHALLESVGAFAGGRRRYFRLPYGDRGRGAERAAVRAAWQALGYEPADVSINLYDWLYEEPLARALAAGDDRSARRIDARYRRAATREVMSAPARSRGHLAAGWVQIAGCHFGDVSLRGLPPLLESLADRVVWSRLAEAVDDRGYRALEADLAQDGILGDRFARSRLRGPIRRAARWLVRAGFRDQIRLGPVWPRWSG